MLSEGSVRMRGELRFKFGVMGRSNRGLGIRRSARPQVFAAALFGQPAFEAARTDGEGGEHLGAWHPARHRCQHPFPKVKRITTHVSEYHIRL